MVVILRGYLIFFILSVFSFNIFAGNDFFLSQNIDAPFIESEPPPTPTKELNIASISAINQNYYVSIPSVSNILWYELWEKHESTSYVKIYSESYLRANTRSSNKTGYMYYYYNVCHLGGCSSGPTSKIRIYSAPNKPTNIQLSPTSIYKYELDEKIRFLIDPYNLEDQDTSSAYPKLSWNTSANLESSIGYYQIQGTFNGSLISDTKLGANVSQINTITNKGIGTYSYAIRACNGSSLCSAWTSKTLIIKNSKPITTKDYFYINEDSGSIILTLTNNDVDKDGHQLTVTKVNSATLGTAWISNNKVYYRPNLNSYGTDELSYTVSDDNGGEATGYATVITSPVNDKPIANNDSITINEDAVNTPIYILSNDSDIDNELHYNQLNIASGPFYGTFQINSNSINYTPGSNYHGSDGFTYTIKDGSGKEDTAVVSITVNSINDLPIITGSPINKVCVSDKYYFKPSATDVDKSDILIFSVSGLPDWVTFNASTGEVTGVPEASNVGKYNNIFISVSDGFSSVGLAPFSIEVTLKCDVRKTIFIHTDLLGSPVVETNEEGGVN